jgi:hypothetical protein
MFMGFSWDILLGFSWDFVWSIFLWISMDLYGGGNIGLLWMNVGRVK